MGIRTKGESRTPNELYGESSMELAMLVLSSLGYFTLGKHFSGADRKLFSFTVCVNRAYTEQIEEYSIGKMARYIYCLQ